MKVLLYFELAKAISKSGIGRALKHQQKALSLVGVETTTDPNDDYDFLLY
jgi:1,2-diacylglycerol-3-alpha-glucose alpha-1,2-glucosyltransferase